MSAGPAIFWDHALLVGDDVAGQLAGDGHDGLVGRVVVVHREVHHAADAHAAQLHRRAEVEAVDRLVEIHHEAVRLAEEAQAAEGQQPDQAEGERSDHKDADGGWTDLGFHWGRNA
jgi:dihydroxyacetone kinase